MVHKTTLVEFRKIILENMGVSFDYYPAYSGVDGHCRWQCTDIECDAPTFKSFPAFKKHLENTHQIYFSEIDWMRFYIRR